ncbi:MAG TPA: hypothetical protein VM370_13635 [Candidatus Thermoplasmatota archaeon]|nr:hypothetical protein [Candidatus Thermoplasmatota archaeon]
MAMTTSDGSDVVPIRFNGLKSAENVVFFGNNLGVECQRCGAYNQTSMGHKFCAHVSCPIALREFKRRKRKRTSSLEKVYIPRYAERGAESLPLERENDV